MCKDLWNCTDSCESSNTCLKRKSFTLFSIYSCPFSTDGHARYLHCSQFSCGCSDSCWNLNRTLLLCITNEDDLLFCGYTWVSLKWKGFMCTGGSKKALLGPKMAKHGRLANAPKWSQMINITCFWPFGTIFGLFAPVWTFADKNQFFASKTQSATWQMCFGA